MIKRIKEVLGTVMFVLALFTGASFINDALANDVIVDDTTSIITETTLDEYDYSKFPSDVIIRGNEVEFPDGHIEYAPLKEKETPKVVEQPKVDSDKIVEEKTKEDTPVVEEKTEEVVKEETPKKSGVIKETTITWEAPETKVDTKVEEPKKPEVNKTEPKVEKPVKPSVDEITKEEPQKDEEITPTTPNVAKQITVPNKPFSYPLLKTGRLANTGITDTNSLYAGLAFFGLASLLIYRRKKA